MTSLHSRPIMGQPWRYQFYVDIDGHRSDDARAPRAARRAASAARSSRRSAPTRSGGTRAEERRRARAGTLPVATTVDRPGWELRPIGRGRPTRLVHRARGRAQTRVAFPHDLDPRLQSALIAQGIAALYVAPGAPPDELARAGGTSCVVTGTASGKSLAYNLPVLRGAARASRARARSTSTRRRPSPRTRRAGSAWAPALRPALYDGDTPRSGARASAARANPS